jgi:hypothetical protein
MTSEEVATRDAWGRYRGVADYLKARADWFVRHGCSPDEAHRLASSDDGGWRAALTPGSGR